MNFSLFSFNNFQSNGTSKHVWMFYQELRIRDHILGSKLLAKIFTCRPGLLNKSNQPFLPREVDKHFAKFHETGVNR